ncbi:MAG: hypothetical protein ACLRMZ_25405 [Blautia marasmi]
MKNKILAALLTITLAGVMTGCGNSSGGGNTDTSAAKSSGSTADSGTKAKAPCLGQTVPQ